MTTSPEILAAVRSSVLRPRFTESAFTESGLLLFTFLSFPRPSSASLRIQQPNKYWASASHSPQLPHLSRLLSRSLPKQRDHGDGAPTAAAATPWGSGGHPPPSSFLPLRRALPLPRRGAVPASPSDAGWLRGELPGRRLRGLRRSAMGGLRRWPSPQGAATPRTRSRRRSFPTATSSHR
jgi:hypothetical protein